MEKIYKQIKALEYQIKKDITYKDKDIHVAALEQLRSIYRYENEDKKCECCKCELENKCNVKDKYQRLPRTCPGALGLCEKL